MCSDHIALATIVPTGSRGRTRSTCSKRSRTLPLAVPWPRQRKGTRLKFTTVTLSSLRPRSTAGLRRSCALSYSNAYSHSRSQPYPALAQPALAQPALAQSALAQPTLAQPALALSTFALDSIADTPNPHANYCSSSCELELRSAPHRVDVAYAGQCNRDAAGSLPAWRLR